MPLLTQITNFGKSAQKLKIILDLETHLSKEPETIFGNSILQAINKKYPYDDIIFYIKSYIDDCSEDKISKVIGKGLAERIKVYQK